MADTKKTLSNEERVNLSWKMLEDIAKKISNFSSKDKKTIRECGAKFRKHGAIYQHNVDQEVKAQQNIAKAVSKNKGRQK